VISVAAAGCSTTSSVDGLAMKQEPSATLVASCRAYYADQPGSIGASSFDSSAAGALRGVRAQQQATPHAVTSHIVIWRKEQALVIVIGRVDIKASVPGLWRIRLPWPAVGKVYLVSTLFDHGCLFSGASGGSCRFLPAALTVGPISAMFPLEWCGLAGVDVVVSRYRYCDSVDHIVVSSGPTRVSVTMLFRGKKPGGWGLCWGIWEAAHGG
jgi:hypothetical protein